MKKYILLTLLLTLSIAFTVKVDAISVFGKDLNFGKIFNKAKPATPISAVVDSKINFEITSPKKGANLEVGNIYNVNWKTSDKIDSYVLTLEGPQKKELGKAYNFGKTFSWLVSKDIKPGNYKLVFTDKYGNKYKSGEFKIIAGIETKSYKFESAIGTPVTDKSYFNVDYKVTSSVAPVGEFNIKVICPSGVSAVLGQDRTDKCNKTISNSLFSKSVSNQNIYNLTLSFTNKNKTSQLVTAELFVGGKSYGKIANMVESTKEVVTPSKPFTVNFPKAGSVLNTGQTYKITWDGDEGDLATSTLYKVMLVGDNYKDGFSLGSVYGFEKMFTQTLPKNILSGKYKLVFSGKAAGGSSEMFTIVNDSVEPVKLGKISSTVTTIKNNNIDVGASANVKMTIQPNGKDILASSILANISIIDVARNYVLATYEVKGITESGLTYIQDGTIKPLEFSAVFPSAVFPTGTTNYSLSVRNVIYKNPGSDAIKGVVENLDVFNSNFTSFTKTEVSTTNILTRNLTIGSSGDDVLLLKKYLVSAGFMDPSSVATSTNYFGNETLVAVKKFQTANGISPADGYVGPLTRIVLNNKMIVIKEI